MAVTGTLSWQRALAIFLPGKLDYDSNDTLKCFLAATAASRTLRTTQEYVRVNIFTVSSMKVWHRSAILLLNNDILLRKSSPCSIMIILHLEKSECSREVRLTKHQFPPAPRTQPRGVQATQVSYGSGEIPSQALHCLPFVSLQELWQPLLRPCQGLLSFET